MRGKVIEFHATKGYGFIQTPDGEKIFVHRDNIRSDKRLNVLHVGDVVEFEITEEKGRQATAVTVVSFRA